MDLIKIGEFLKELRKEKGYTQQEVADKLYVSPKSVSRWENGDGIPDINIVTLVADVYGITVDELLRGERLKSNILRDEKISSKDQQEKILSKLNIYLIVSLSVFGLLLVLGVILGFIYNSLILVILLVLGLIISSIVYGYGNSEVKRRINIVDDLLEEDKNNLKLDMMKKNIFFLDIFVVGITIVSIITIDSIDMILIPPLVVITYLILRPYLKKIEKNPEELKARLKLIMGINAILMIIFLIYISYSIEITPVGVGVIEIKKTIIIQYLIDCINYGLSLYKLIALILYISTIIGLIITTIVKFKHKILMYIIFITAGLISNILPIYDSNRYQLAHLNYGGYTVSILGIVSGLILLGSFIEYYIIHTRGKKDERITN